MKKVGQKAIIFCEVIGRQSSVPSLTRDLCFILYLSP